MIAATTLKQMMFRLAVVVVSLVVALIAIEIGLRIVAPSEHVPQREYDAYLGWRGRPNLDCKLRERHFCISISQNSAGFRDRERVWEKQDGLTRALFVGDSFTWGWAIEQDAVFTTLLEQRLDRQHSPIEVINAGVGGYSTDQILLYLQREGFRYSPDVVVYQVARNDIPGNTMNMAEGLYSKPFFNLDDGGRVELHGCPVAKFSPLQHLMYLVSRHSRLAYMIKHRLHASFFFRRGREAQPQRTSREVQLEQDDYAFRLFCALTRQMQKECEQHNSRLVVLLDFELNAERLQYWGRECREVEAHFVQDYLLARQEDQGTPAFIPHDGHWSEAGHRWIADYVYDHILLDL